MKSQYLLENYNYLLKILDSKLFFGFIFLSNYSDGVFGVLGIHTTYTLVVDVTEFIVTLKMDQDNVLQHHQNFWHH